MNHPRLIVQGSQQRADSETKAALKDAAAAVQEMRATLNEVRAAPVAPPVAEASSPEGQSGWSPAGSARTTPFSPAAFQPPDFSELMYAAERNHEATLHALREMIQLYTRQQTQIETLVWQLDLFKTRTELARS